MKTEQNKRNIRTKIFKSTNQDNNTKETESQDKTKLIFKPYIARKLLKEGHQIVDIKPDHTDPVRTVFVFKDSLKLRDDMARALRERDELAKKENMNAED